MNDWTAIHDGGLLLYVPALFSTEEADAHFAWLRSEMPWKQERIFNNPVPRLNAWFSDAGLEYRYSGLKHVGEGWLPELTALKEKVEAASGTTFNSLLLNLYRNGRDSISFHADDEPELGVNPVVATVSFGAEREFVLKHRTSKDVLKYRLPHGSVLVMGGTSQHHWLHALPKTTETVGERISLTFRRIVIPA